LLYLKVKTGLKLGATTIEKLGVFLSSDGLAGAGLFLGKILPLGS